MYLQVWLMNIYGSWIFNTIYLIHDSCLFTRANNQQYFSGFKHLNKNTCYQQQIKAGLWLASPTETNNWWKHTPDRLGC